MCNVIIRNRRARRMDFEEFQGAAQGVVPSAGLVQSRSLDCLNGSVTSYVLSSITQKLETSGVEIIC